MLLTGQQKVYLEKVHYAKAHQIPVFQLKPEDLDARGDFEFPTPNGETQRRGGMDYKQPSNKWTRVGLRVKGTYDNGDDSWLSCTGGSGEWAVAFHGSKTVAGNIGT